MKSILKLIRTTLVGGILFLLPIVVLAIIIGKALALSHKIVRPLATHLPVSPYFKTEEPTLLAIGLLVLVCFLAGFLAKTAMARRGVGWLEETLLSNIPGYEFIKSLSWSLLVAENRPVYPVVLARLEDAWQLAFLIERLEADHVAVFVPGAPSPKSGSVYFLTHDRIKLMDVPPAQALKCLKRYGLGANTLLGNRLATANPLELEK